eukprot:TRINITY_DN56049_c0_g1_i1.p2 TRINITY_DN56049_c0_g1~~TRINITY_DN56049_c0_g1_i1.p2  ORF type:complete len:271 (-),score=66.41 TRINITY_DN56049_c0_g1_i1:39-767(-)
MPSLTFSSDLSADTFSSEEAPATAPALRAPRRRISSKRRELGLPFSTVPDESRLRPSGAILEGSGRLKDSAYKDLIERFASELPKEHHFDRFRPGLAADEVQPEGLKVWDDQHSGRGKEGAGWIAVAVESPDGGKLEEKWFNVQTWGSWRLAFILARLQRKVWEYRAGLTPLDYEAEDKFVEVGGVRMTPAEIRKHAHALARALRGEQDMPAPTIDIDIGGDDSLKEPAKKQPRRARGAGGE